MQSFDLLDKETINIQVFDAIAFRGQFGAYVWVDPAQLRQPPKH